MLNANNLQLRSHKFLRVARAIICLFVAAQLLLSAAMAASPVLHRALHHDADSPDHGCLATMLAQGHVTLADPVVALVAVALLISFLSFIQSLPPRRCLDVSLPAGRAPPVL